jgi:hypothetical protein
MSIENKGVAPSDRKQGWSKPKLRAVVPASHTRGGIFPNSPLDDTFYRIS